MWDDRDKDSVGQWMVGTDVVGGTASWGYVNKLEGNCADVMRTVVVRAAVVRTVVTIDVALKDVVSGLL